jgi:hypothetical protein
LEPDRFLAGRGWQNAVTMYDITPNDNNRIGLSDLECEKCGSKFIQNPDDPLEFYCLVCDDNRRVR